MMPAFISEIKESSFWLAVLAEFLGSFLLVLFGCGSCGYGESLVSIALGFGLTVGTIVWIIGHVSGGHINPAVTFGFLVTRKMSLVKAIFYIIFQCCGATLGSLVLLLTYFNSDLKDALCAPSVVVPEFAGFLVEALITFLLVLVVFSTCDSLKKGFSGSGPLAIGLSVTVGHFWAVKLTGAGTNPARVFGPALVSGKFESHWVYWVGPLVGGAVAALLYDLVFAVNACREKFKAFFTSKYYDEADYSSDGANIIHIVKETADVKTASV